MAYLFKQLGQLRPADTNPASVYSPAAGVVVGIAREIYVTNVTALVSTYSIYFDSDGTTYSEDTAIFLENAIAANQTIQIDCKIYLDDASANLAVATGIADSVNFTVFGQELT